MASKQLTAELSERMNEARKRNPAWGLEEDVQAMIDVARTITEVGKTPPPAAPLPATTS